MATKEIKALVSQAGVYLITGPSGSGKTTFVEGFRPSIYMNQYHNIRPEGFINTFFAVSDMQLPFTPAPKIRFGGQHMPGMDVKGLSGGQRKLTIVAMINLVVVRTKVPMLIVVDEPLAGVTADYCEFITNHISKWGSDGHTVLVIDNDHLDLTTTLGWNRLHLGPRKVASFNGKTVDLSVPLSTRQRTPVPKDPMRDFMLFAGHDLVNMANLTNTRCLTAIIVQLITVPFVYNPVIDTGATFCVMAYFMMIGNTAWGFVPGRIVQYNRVQNEAQIGLVSHRGLTILFMTLHDLLLSTVIIVILFAILSGGHHLQRFTVWQVCLAACLVNMRWCNVSMSPAFSGMPFPLCNFVQLLHVMGFFYFGGVLSVNDVVGTRASYVSADVMYVQFATNHSAYPPGAPIHTVPEVELVVFILWLTLDAFMIVSPLVISELEDRKALQQAK